MKIKVGISNRHVHLSKEDIELLFGKDYILTKKRDLSQDNNYACFESVNLSVNGKVIENVRVVGPAREKSQVEISKLDAEYLNIDPPYRNSGDLDDAITIEISTKLNKIVRKSCIIANRHIHMTSDLALNIGFKNNDVVKVKLDDENILDNVYIKISEGLYPELHLDTFDSSKYDLTNDSCCEIIL